MRIADLSGAVIRTGVVLLIMSMIFASFAMSGISDVHASSLSGTGKIKTSDVNLRKSATTSSRSIARLKKNTKLTITKEVFTDKKSTASTKRWYYVTAGKKSGYVRADLVKNIKFSGVTAYTTDELNYRTGPGTCYKRLGSVKKGSTVKLLLNAVTSDDDTIWYRAKVNGKTAYLCGDYITTMPIPEVKHYTEAQLKGKSELAVALLSNPTYSGRARYVYTFDTKNCKKLFAVKGYSGITTPQGMAYSGDKYYLLYGNNAGQRIVTYSADGKRLKATKFSFSIGHPNGITWDPVTKLCYIFKGHQKKIYTWDPATNKFGKSQTPYNCSGGAYDASTKLIYGSSKPRLYVYSSDGSFTLSQFFNRCNHGIVHSAQDCGASGGFLFHAVSGVNYRKTNFLDVYRISDMAYLGSIKVTLGETESVIVDKKGYVELLINHSGTTDYIWKTPLNVKDLKM